MSSVIRRIYQSLFQTPHLSAFAAIRLLVLQPPCRVDPYRILIGIMKSSGRTTSRHFRCISFTLPESSGFHKAFMVLTPNYEMVRSNFLIGESSKVDEHGDQYQVEKIDFALRPTYPFLLTTKLSTTQPTTNLQNNQSTGKVDNKRRVEEEAAS